MEKRADGMVEVEAGDEILVVTAKHQHGTAIVGTFTSYRLAGTGAKAYADEYGKNDDGAMGPVIKTFVYSTCLDQHGTCPQVTNNVCAIVPSGSPMVDRFVAIGGGSTQPVPHPGPYTRETFTQGLPDYSLLVGPSRVVESAPVVWDLFDLDGCEHGDVDVATRRIGAPVQATEPEVDSDFEKDGYDEFDAALSYLRAGGALCKVPDWDGSAHFRLMVVAFPGSPVHGNCS